MKTENWCSLAYLIVTMILIPFAGIAQRNVCIATVSNQPTTVVMSSQPQSQVKCTGSSASFSVTASGTAPLSYQWTKNSAIIQNATSSTYTISNVSISDTGVYNCNVTNLCRTIASNSAVLSVNITPNSPFTIDPAILIDDTVTITYTGTALSASTYNWNLNGGVTTTGSGQGPLKVKWNQSGVKNVSLSVTGLNGCVSPATNHTIQVKPTSYFSMTSTTCIGGYVNISYTGSASISASYTWDFDGGTVISGSGQGPYQVSWSSSGAKNVSLSVAENGTSSSTLKTINIISTPSSDFIISDSVCVGANANIVFNGTPGSNTIYNWNFGTGTIISGTGVGPYQVMWSTSGLKYVSLSISDGGCNSLLTSKTVYVKNLPSSTFNLQMIATSEDSVVITYTGSEGSSATYSWNFGGGSTISGTGQGPYKIRWLTSGIKTVSLSVTGVNSCTSLLSTANIQISPSSSFVVNSPVNVGSHSTITYTGTASASAIYNWNFDLGTIISGSGQGPYQISWNTSGVKNISLNVTENGASSPQTTHQVTVNPLSTFSCPASVCQGDTISVLYTGSASTSATYNWNLNSGIVASGSGQGPIKVLWNTSGPKIISLQVVENNCTSSVYTDTVLVYPIPTSSFSATSPISTIDSCTVNYTGSASINAGFTWGFAGAAVISGAGIGPYKLKWSSSGIKPISLTVAENGCVSNPTIVPIVVNPTSTFNTDSAICIGDSALIIYTGQSLSTAIYNWGFDGGQILSGVGQGPYLVKWLSPGIKAVTLIVYENGLGSSQSTKNIIINQLPSISVSQNSTICLHDSVLLQANVISGANPVSYSWSSGSTMQSTYADPFSDSTFVITVTDGNGCKTSDSILVKVNAPFSSEEICVVTIDSATNKNIIVWSKTPNVGTVFTKIFKESTVINVYDSIGYVSFDSLSYFIDYSSSPEVKSAKYKISIVDSCGNESDLSPHHRTMHLTINKGIGWQFNLIWTPYEGFTVPTYKIWRWANLQTPALIDSVSGSMTSYTDNSAPIGLIYYMVEVICPTNCSVSKANTNYNTSRSNVSNTQAFIGIDDNDAFAKGIIVYPNPTKDFFYIKSKNFRGKAQFVFYDITGQTILKQELDFDINKEARINIQGISKGIYYLHIISNLGQISGKIIIY